MGCPLSVPWDEASPSGATTPADTIDTELQNLKISIRERLEDIIPGWSDDTICPKVLGGKGIAGLFGGKRATFSASGDGNVDAVFEAATDIIDIYYIRVDANLGADPTIAVDLLDIDATITGTSLAIIGVEKSEWTSVEIIYSGSGLMFEFHAANVKDTIDFAAGGNIIDVPLENIIATFDFWVAVIE